MGFNPREFLKRLRETNPQIHAAAPAAFEAYVQFQEQALAPGKVDARTKELAALAVSVFAKCPYCIPYHVQRALKLGITPEEMIEMGMVAASIGGGASMTYVSQMVQAINEITASEESPESL